MVQRGEAMTEQTVVATVAVAVAVVAAVAVAVTERRQRRRSQLADGWHCHCRLLLKLKHCNGGDRVTGRSSGQLARRFLINPRVPT